MTQINKLSDIVNNGLCVGCGVCQSIAGKDKIEVMMSPKGRLEPKEINKISPDVFEFHLSYSDMDLNPSDFLEKSSLASSLK